MKWRRTGSPVGTLLRACAAAMSGANACGYGALTTLLDIGILRDGRDVCILPSWQEQRAPTWRPQTIEGANKEAKLLAGVHRQAASFLASFWVWAPRAS